ncbi:hypothetical protein [Actinomyces sp. B33]|uniref:hypothetical protein n=1 Tax=Actinomyces sp. B33 TaxID=2942131 RepID=UPI0023410CD1|nr:hypothetical protein [Actinomyces sp. B33]
MDERSTWERALTFRSVLDLEEASSHSWYPDVLVRLAGADRPGDLTARSVVSAPFLVDVARASGDLADNGSEIVRVLSDHLREAARSRHRLWVSVLPAGDVARLEDRLGPGLVSVAGPESDGAVPVAVNPSLVLDAWSDDEGPRRGVVARALGGIDALTALPAAVRAASRAGAHFIDRSALIKLIVSPTFIAYAVVFIYSTLRALPVVLVPGFTGKVWVLWTIDVVTAVPYTWGIIAMVAGRRLSKRILGFCVTVATFVAPYVYFWMHGREAPLGVLAFIAAMFVGAIALEVIRWWRDSSIRRGLAR